MQAEDHRFLSVMRRVAQTAGGAPIRQILNVGAGQCSECAGLLDLFPDACLTLIDRDRRCMRDLGAYLLPSAGSLQVVHAEAGEFLSNTSVTYDLVLVRHPDVHQNPGQWRSIFQCLWSHLSTNGILIATFYSHSELRFVQRLLQISAFEPWLASEDVGVPVPLDGRDRYILGYIKQRLKVRSARKC